MSNQAIASEAVAPQSPKAVMFRVFGAAALTLAILMNAGAAARAQYACTTHEEMARQLKDRHGESRTALAVTGKGGLLEVYASPDGATWTVTVTLVDGRTCVLLSGEDWYDARQVAQGPQV